MVLFNTASPSVGLILIHDNYDHIHTICVVTAYVIPIRRKDPEADNYDRLRQEGQRAALTMQARFLIGYANRQWDSIIPWCSRRVPPASHIQ